MPSLHPPEMQPGRGESRIEEAQEVLRDEGLEEPAPRGRVGPEPVNNFETLTVNI